MWLREDQQRTFEQCKDCYLDFIQQLRKATVAVHDAGYELTRPLKFKWNVSLYESLLRLRVFATADAAAAAEIAYDKTVENGQAGLTVHAEPDRFCALQDSAFEAEEALLEIVRLDLGVEAGARGSTPKVR